MKPEKANKFANAFGTLASYFEKEISQQLTNLYWENLKQYPIEDIESAFSKAIATLRFFPKIIEIHELMGCGPGKIEDVAQVQADLVIKAIRQIGAYQSVDIKDPVTKAVIVSCYGGWIRMCEELLEVDEKWYRKDFVKFYQAYKRQGIKVEHYLSGRHEIENRALGYLDHVTEPVQIEAALSDELKQIENKMSITA